MYLSRNKTTVSLKNPTAITIGTFDGVHIGHRKIIERLIATAKAQKLESTILTFFPHPRMVLQQNADLKLLNTIDERIEILKNSGIDNLIIYPFSRSFSRMDAEEYIEEILLEKLNAKCVIIGYDHHFGRNRTADIQDLCEYGKQYDFEVQEIAKQDVDDVSVSSTKIRRALKKGNIEKANRYLGAPYILSGTVKRGKQLGTELGFPTANLHIEENYKLIPKMGIYVVQSNLEGETYYGMMSIGTNPTVGGMDRSIETHFFGWDKELYGKDLKIEMLTRIRDEVKFGNKEELIQAMKKDEEFSKNFIQGIGNT